MFIHIKGSSYLLRFFLKIIKWFKNLLKNKFYNFSSDNKIIKSLADSKLIIN